MRSLLMLSIPVSIRSGIGAGELGGEMGAETDLPSRPILGRYLAIPTVKADRSTAGLLDCLSVGYPYVVSTQGQQEPGISTMNGSVRLGRAGLAVVALLVVGVAQGQDLVFESGFECISTPELVDIPDPDAFPLLVSNLPSMPEYRYVPFFGAGLDRIITSAPSTDWSVSVSASAGGPFFPETSTTVAAGSNGISLPATTVNVESTAGFPAAGVITVVTQSGPREVSCTGSTPTSFTGCSGGSETLSLGDTVSLTMVTSQGGSCAVDDDADDDPETSYDGRVIYRASETPGTDSCYVRVCGECGGVESCAVTRLPFVADDINAPPILTATGLNPTYIEGSPEVDLFGSVSATAIEDATQNLIRLDLTVTQVLNGAVELLTIDGTAISLSHGNAGNTAINAMNYSVSVAANTATLVLAAVDGIPAATMSAIIDGIAYRNDSANPIDGLRSVNLTRLDDSGSNPGNSATFLISSTVSVVPINNAPVIFGLEGDVLLYVSSSGSMRLDQATAASVLDPDSPDFSGGVLTVTISIGYNDRPVDALNVQAGGSITVAGSSIKIGPTTIATFVSADDTLLVVFNSNATSPLVVSDVVRNVTFSNSSGTGLGASRIVTFEISDGDGATSFPSRVTVLEDSPP